MSDEILLYLILLLMLVLAVGALVPSLLRVGREEASVEREDKAYGSAVTEALRRQRAQLDEDLKSGAVSAEQYEILADDLRRRALEEHDAVFHDPNDGAGRRAGSFSGPVVTAAVVAGVTAVSVGLYAVNGAPELIGLEKAQAVYDGRADTPSIERYLESSPKDGRAWVLLARRHVDEENFPKAAEAYRRGRVANAKVKADPAVMLELAATLLTIGGPDSMREAQPLAQGAVEGRPGDMKAVEILTVAASANEDWRTAAESLSLLMSTMNPDTPEYVQYEMTLKRLRELAASQKTPLPSTSRRASPEFRLKSD